jgi:pimeloyl-ACP methyl ester carboxylesterase
MRTRPFTTGSRASCWRRRVLAGMRCRHSHGCGRCSRRPARGDPERAAKLWAETPIMALKRNPAASAPVTSLVMSNSRLWTFKRTEQPLSPPAAKRLSEIKCPVLVIVGDQDLPHIAEVAGVLAKGIPGARLVTVPGAGHIVNLDAPEPFNEAVAAFLGGR